MLIRHPFFFAALPKLNETCAARHAVLLLILYAMAGVFCFGTIIPAKNLCRIFRTVNALFISGEMCFGDAARIFLMPARQSCGRIARRDRKVRIAGANDCAR